MEELLPKDRNSRAVQVFGADGRAQWSRNRENYLLVWSRDRKTSNKPIQVLFPSLQFIPVTSTFARLGWHHSGLHLATDTLKCPQHKSYSHLQAGQPGHEKQGKREEKQQRNGCDPVIGGEDKRRACS